MQVPLSNMAQWKSAPQNISNQKSTKNTSSLFNTLNNTVHLTSYFKNGLSKNTIGKPIHGDEGNSTFKRRVLDLKCKLAALQSERTRKSELESKLADLEKQKQKEEREGRSELDELMRTLSHLKGELEEQKTRLTRAELKRDIKTQDLRKIEDLVAAKGEEKEDLSKRRGLESRRVNDLLAEKDSLEKEAFLTREEANRLDLEEARLDRQLREARARQKATLEQTERVQVSIN